MATVAHREVSRCGPCPPSTRKDARRGTGVLYSRRENAHRARSQEGTGKTGE